MIGEYYQQMFELHAEYRWHLPIGHSNRLMTKTWPQLDEVSMPLDECYAHWRSVMQTDEVQFNLFCWYVKYLWTPPMRFTQWRLPNVLFNWISTIGQPIMQKGVLIIQRSRKCVENSLKCFLLETNNENNFLKNSEITIAQRSFPESEWIDSLIFLRAIPIFR